MNIDPKDAEQGVYEKFRVERTDGRSAPGEKHHGCTYFVLDVDHDPYARPALKAYADSCESAFPALAADLRKIRNGHLRFGEAAPGLESISHTVEDGTPGPAPGAAEAELNAIRLHLRDAGLLPSLREDGSFVNPATLVMRLWAQRDEAQAEVAALRAELARAGTSEPPTLTSLIGSMPNLIPAGMSSEDFVRRLRDRYHAGYVEAEAQTWEQAAKVCEEQASGNLTPGSRDAAYSCAVAIRARADAERRETTS